MAQSWFSVAGRCEHARQAGRCLPPVGAFVGFFLFSTALSFADDGNPKVKTDSVENLEVQPGRDAGEVDAELKAAIDSLVVKAAQGPPPGEGELWVRWWELLRNTENALDKLFEGRATRSNVEYYWSQFGKHGGVTDYVLVAAAPGMMHPGDGSLFNGRWPEEAEKLFPKTGYRLNIVGSEVQTRSFLADRDKLMRYHRLILWSHLVYDRPELHGVRVKGRAMRTEELFADKDNQDKYWGAARNFVLLAYATGREDLLDDVKAEDLRPRFAQWYKWVREKSPWLAANPKTLQWKVGNELRRGILEWDVPPMPLPLRPCDDWDDNVPLPNARIIAKNLLVY
ncbi:MAG: hypothetical protein WD069_21570 [Planctomycetales bacterium]